MHTNTVLCVILHLLSCFILYSLQDHTNEFAVHIKGPKKLADVVAKKYGFVNKGQVGSLESYYIFEHPSLEKRSAEHSSYHVDLLKSDSSVEWCEQQVIQTRVKRYVKETADKFIDPLYPEQWFLHDGGYDGYDMNVRPAWNKGFTGKGVVVSILDDGIQSNHPDLELNYDKDASFDINSEDEDPSPRDNDDNKHGTRCAGEVAAVANNEYCGVGVAFNAKIGGVRMLDGSVTDKIEAMALSLNPNHIHIYSASWGPEDNGKTVEGPGTLAKTAFENGITKGRNGLGSIFVWASGNGGKHKDNCNCDGYTNSIYTISISSATQSGLKPWYLEECSSTLTTTYSSGETDRDKDIVTVDVNYGYSSQQKNVKESFTSGLCTKSHTGTSASAPIAAGLCALALEANPNLTWRDMQHIVILTSRYMPLRKEPGWILNAVGRKVSTKFGYGLMDGDAMVTVAKKWKTVPAQHICYSVPNNIEKFIPSESGGRVESSIETDGCKNSKDIVNYLEHVQVRITCTFHPRGNLHIILVSPSGTASPILQPRIHDRQEGSFLDWPFMSVHFWGERAEGIWKLIIINDGTLISSSSGKLSSWTLIFYGTKNLPDFLNSNSTRKENGMQLEFFHPIRTLNDSTHSTLMDCKLHQQYLMNIGNQTNYCTNKCPPGMYGNRKQSVCHKCFEGCLNCYGPSSDNCLACSSNYMLFNSTCVQSCPEGYFSNSTSFSRACSACSPNCATCAGINKCITCQDGYVFFKSQCLLNCPPGTYAFKEKCLECSGECTNCYGSSKSDCLACSNGFYLFNTTCSPGCPLGYFLSNGKRCVKCHRSCKSCDNPITCVTCNNYYKISQDVGVCEFMGCSLDDSNTQCSSNCEPKCELCSSKDCYVCKSNYLWSDGFCLKDCSISSYKNIDECSQCLGKCLSCEDPYSCISCQSGFYLIENQCAEVCPHGYFGDNRGICMQCHVSCNNCFGPSNSNCTTCPPQTFLHQNTCLDRCPVGFYNERGSMTCLKCHPSCKECSGYGPFSCLRCYFGSSLVGKACIPCSNKDFSDTDICTTTNTSYTVQDVLTEDDDPISTKAISIVFGVSFTVILVFVVLFIVLHCGSPMFHSSLFQRKKYYKLDASFEVEQEKVSLTQEVYEDDEEISPKL